MAIKTTSSARVVTEGEAFANANVNDSVTGYNAYVAGKMADATKTWTVRIVASYHDGANHVIVAEGSYPEYSDDGTQVPVAP